MVFTPSRLKLYNKRKKMKNKIYYFTNVASHYRKCLWEKLISSDDFDFHFYFGDNKSFKIKEIDFSIGAFKANKNKLHRLKNFTIKGKIVFWQSDVITTCLTKKIGTAIFLGEFQVISTWIAVVICKIRGIKSVFWTHGLYGNESYIKNFFRVKFYKMADELLIYERRAKELLKGEGLDEVKLKVIYNSLDYDKQKKIRVSIESNDSFSNVFFKNNSLPYLIFVGRLTKVKRLDLLIQALKIINKNEDKLNLLFLGDGDEKESLISLVKEFKLEKHVYFYGACYDESLLSKFIYHACLCVSPGNIGLTAVHALSFGTPICTHNNFYNQMPEVEVLEEGCTGIFFEENKVESLTKSIVKWVFDMDKDRKVIRENCFKVIDDLYNPYNQVNIIKKVIK